MPINCLGTAFPSAEYIRLTSWQVSMCALDTQTHRKKNLDTQKTKWYKLEHEHTGQQHTKCTEVPIWLATVAVAVLAVFAIVAKHFYAARHGLFGRSSNSGVNALAEHSLRCKSVLVRMDFVCVCCRYCG